MLKHTEIPLYDELIPNARAVPNREIVVERGDKGRVIFEISEPSLTIFKPKTPNGKAIIICPGGGYFKLSIDKEGLQPAQYLAEAGYTSFVLKYRTPSDSSNVYKSLAPLQDIQQAIRFVRNHASEYNIGINNIGVMGFSAGGHLAAAASTHFNLPADHNQRDLTSVRPDFTILVYPVISFADDITHYGSRENLLGRTPSTIDKLFWSCESHITAQTPKVFLVHAGDDNLVSIRNSLVYYDACIKYGVLAEMHLYPRGGHGFGLKNTLTKDSWPDRLLNWLKGIE